MRNGFPALHNGKRSFAGIATAHLCDKTALPGTIRCKMQREAARRVVFRCKKLKPLGFVLDVGAEQGRRVVGSVENLKNVAGAQVGQRPIQGDDGLWRLWAHRHGDVLIGTVVPCAEPCVHQKSLARFEGGIGNGNLLGKRCG